MKRSPLFTIFLVVFFDLVGFGVVIPILPYYSKSFGASAFELGWLMAIYSIAQFLFSPVWGSLSDRFGRRPILLLTIIGGSSAMVATALAGSYWILFLTRFLAGLFGANISTASAYIADVTSIKDRAKGMGIIGAGFGLGFIFGPAIGGVLSVHGYSTPILFAAGLGFFNFLLAFFILEESIKPNTDPSASRRTFNLSGLREAFGKKSTARPILLFFLNTLAFTQIEVIFGLFVLGRFGFDARSAGWLLAGMGIIGAILQGGLIGRLASRYGESNLAPIGFALLCIAIAGSGFAPTPTLFAAFLFFVAIGNGLVNPSLSSLVSKGADENRRGVILGIYQSAGSFARIVGPPVSGFLFDALGPASPLFASSILMALALVCAFLWRKNTYEFS